MHPSLARLLSSSYTERRQPAALASIRLIEENMGIETIPARLHELWMQSDGLVLRDFNALWLGTGEVLEFFQSTWGPFCVELGLLPLIDTNSSNWLMLTVKPPLAPRLLYVMHDGDVRVLYREPETFMEILPSAIEMVRSKYDDDIYDSDSFFYRAPGDYAPEVPRSPADRAAGRELLSLEVSDAGDALDFRESVASQLIDERDLETIAAFLDREWQDVSFVRNRFKHTRDARVLALFAQDECDHLEFTQVMAQAAREAGAAQVRQAGKVLWINNQPFNTRAFFRERKQTNAYRRLVVHFQDMLAGVDYRMRSDHYFSN